MAFSLISDANPSVIDEMAALLERGGVVVYPTETCYGLGCDALNNDAVERIFRIKERDPRKPVLMIAHDVSVLMRYVQWNEAIEELGSKYWPGALTIVAKAKANTPLARGVQAEDDTIAFRVTSHPIASALARRLDSPLISTSANLSSAENPYEIEYLVRTFEGRKEAPDAIIDSGNLTHRSPSTIVRVEADGTKTVIRQGDIIIS